MAAESRLDAQHLLRRWVLATFGGWLLGIVAVILLGGYQRACTLETSFPLGSAWDGASDLRNGELHGSGLV
jgi:hypothetical protein